MWKEKYDTLKSEFDLLREVHDKMAARLEKLLNDVPSKEPAPSAPKKGSPGSAASTRE